MKCDGVHTLGILLSTSVTQHCVRIFIQHNVVMKLYDIYAHPKLGTTAVAHGFSWSAFFIPSVWAAQKGLGAITLYLTAVTTMAFNLTEQIPTSSLLSWTTLLSALTCIGLIAGRKAYVWHTGSLKKSGFNKQQSVVAQNPNHALTAFHHSDYSQSAPIAA